MEQVKGSEYFQNALYFPWTYSSSNLQAGPSCQNMGENGTVHNQSGYMKATGRLRTTTSAASQPSWSLIPLFCNLSSHAILITTWLVTRYCLRRLTEGWKKHFPSSKVFVTSVHTTAGTVPLSSEVLPEFDPQNKTHKPRRHPTRHP